MGGFLVLDISAGFSNSGEDSSIHPDKKISYEVVGSF